MVEFNFTPFPELHSERLVLRRIVESDLDRVFEIRSNPEVMKYIPRPLAKTMDDVLQWLSVINNGIETNEAINWAISFKETPTEFVGLIGYFRPDKENERAEVGYILHPKFQKMGIIGEAMGPVRLWVQSDEIALYRRRNRSSKQRIGECINQSRFPKGSPLPRKLPLRREMAGLGSLLPASRFLISDF